MMVVSRVAGAGAHVIMTVGLRRFFCDRRGSVALIFSLVALPVIGITGVAIDYGLMGLQRSKMQAAADRGAIQAGKELRLAQMGSAYALISMARNYALAALPAANGSLRNVAANASLSTDKKSITVSVSATYIPFLFKAPAIQLGVKATASSVGYPVCALALEPAKASSISARTQAQVTAQFCAVHANSKDPQAINAQGNAKVTAGLICSSGGYKGKFNITPLTDCPVIQDPLAGRPPPVVGGCTYTNQKIKGGTVTLMPGHYCGGLKVSDGAIVTLSPGVYVISNGKLEVDDKAKLTSNGAGVYLTGNGATLQFEEESTVSLVAPSTGPMAGLLFFEDPTAPTGQTHYIGSDNAPTLLGTIYLPRNQLKVDTNKDVGKASAFTIIIANSIYVDKGSNLWLNSDYASTSVPVPGGLNAGRAFLTR